MVLAAYRPIILSMKMASALTCRCPESRTAFIRRGMAAIMANIMAIKCVRALPGSFTLVRLRFSFAVIYTSLLIIKTDRF